MIPNPPALAAMGLSPHSRIFIRRAFFAGRPGQRAGSLVQHRGAFGAGAGDELAG